MDNCDSEYDEIPIKCVKVDRNDHLSSQILKSEISNTGDCCKDIIFKSKCNAEDSEIRQSRGEHKALNREVDLPGILKLIFN